MTGPDQGFLLLTSQLGDPEREPLTVAQFRNLAKRAMDGKREVTARDLEIADLTALGYDRQMAERIYGLLAGTISTDAELEAVSIVGSCLQIDSDCYFGVDEYIIGLVCGMGDPSRVNAEISCQVVGSAPERIVATVEDNEVTLEFVA